MKLHRQNGTLCLGAIQELTAANARAVRHALLAELDPELHLIEIDLAQAAAVDSAGLSALVSVMEAAESIHPSGVLLRLRDPLPPVLQMLELTRADQIFEIVYSAPEPGPAAPLSTNRLGLVEPAAMPVSGSWTTQLAE